MGAPTGSFDVRMRMRPRDTGWPAARPVMVTVAGEATERCLMAFQTAAAGVQVWAAASSGVSVGGLLVSDTQSGSMGPMRRRGPGETA